MTKLYRMVELSNLKVGAYVLKWDREWGQPEVGFCEDEEENTQAIEAIPDMIEALLSALAELSFTASQGEAIIKVKNALKKAGR